jgi:hypothetical protein
MIILREDPAERSGYLRYFYRNWRPTRFGRIHNRIYAWISALGLTPPILITLQVRSRSNGRLCSIILATVNYEGSRYAVSMLGDNSEWVKNIRAAGGDACIKRGRSISVKLIEVPPADRAEILKAWCQVAPSGRRHLPVSHEAPVSAFEAIAGNYPVFRIDLAQSR